MRFELLVIKSRELRLKKRRLINQRLRIQSYLGYMRYDNKNDMFTDCKKNSFNVLQDVFINEPIWYP